MSSLFLNQRYRKTLQCCDLLLVLLFWSFKRCLQMSSEPPLSGGMRPLCAAELRVDGPMMAKVVFAWHRARSWVKLAAGMTAVNVPHRGGTLPDACCQMYAHVPADVDVFHFHALPGPDKIDDVEVLEVATDVVSEIDAMGWVAACCSPVSGMTLQRPHSCKT